MFLKGNDFKGRPYAYLTNQAGHFLLGFFGVAFYVWVNFLLSGLYLNQTAAAAIVALSYLCFIELFVQGWRGLDTIQDTYFFSLGAGSWHFIDMEQVIHRLGIFGLILGLSLLIGTVREMGR